MNSTITSLVPGIVRTFDQFGYSIHVTEVNGQIGITLRRGDWTESRQFPIPATNADLSEQLITWREELMKGH